MTVPAATQASERPLSRQQDTRYPGPHPASKAHPGGMPSSQSQAFDNQGSHQPSVSSFARVISKNPVPPSKTPNWATAGANQSSSYPTKQPQTASHTEIKPQMDQVQPHSTTQSGGQSFAKQGPQAFRPSAAHAGLPKNAAPPVRSAQGPNHPHPSQAKHSEQAGNLMTERAKQDFKQVYPGSTQHVPAAQPLAPKKINPHSFIKQERGDVFSLQLNTPDLPSKTPKPAPPSALKRTEPQVRQPTLGSSTKRSAFQTEAPVKRAKKNDHVFGATGTEFDMDALFFDEEAEDSVDDIMYAEFDGMVAEPKLNKHLFKIPPEFASPEALMNQIDTKSIIHHNLEVAKAFDPEHDWETARDLFERANESGSEIIQRFEHINACFAQLIERKDEVLADKVALTNDYQSARVNISRSCDMLGQNTAKVASTKRKGGRGRSRSASEFHK